MANTAIADELAGADELEELYRLDASESEPEDEGDDEEDDDEPKEEPKEEPGVIPHG